MNTQRSIGFLFLVVVITGIARQYFAGGLAVSHKIQINFWNGWTGPDGRVMLRIIRDFNRTHPNIEVTMQRLPWAIYYNKLMVAETDQRGPQVFVIHASTLPRMEVAGFVANADSMFQGADGIPISDYNKYVFQQVMYQGHPMGVPLDIHPQGLYCNADMLKEIGYVNPNGSPRPPRNKAEFMDAMRKLMKVEPNGTVDRYGYALTIWQNNFQSLMPQFNGHFLDAHGNADLACPGNIAALTFLQDLSQKDHLVPPPDNALGWTGFRQKKVGMVWEGVYMIGDLKSLANFHAVGAPIPTIGYHPGTMADSHVLCMKEGLDPATADAAKTFIHYLSDNSIRWAEAGQVPARKSIRALPAFKKMQVQYAFSKQIPYMMYPAHVPELFEMSTEISLAVEKVIRGNATPAKALQEANVRVQAVIDRDRKEGLISTSGGN